MLSEELIIERIPGYDHVVRIPLTELGSPGETIAGLLKTVESCLRAGKINFIIDLRLVEFPSASLIAGLIEATSKIRRLDGEIKLLNVSRSARNNLATFSPLSYLALEKDEAYALREFAVPNPHEINVDVETDDIVEDPLIEKLRDSLGSEPAEERDDPTEEIHTEELKPKNYEIEPDNHLRVSSDTNNLYTICDFITGFAEEAGLGRRAVGKMKIAVYEACLNIIEHGYNADPDNWIDVWADFDQEKLTVVIKDYGKSFEDLSQKDYDVLAAMDHRQTGGFGLYIIRRSMDEVEYNADKLRGNRLKLVKYLG